MFEPSADGLKEAPHRKTGLFVSAGVWRGARTIVEDLHEQVARGNRQEGKRDLGDYTSLYWDPGEKCVVWQYSAC